MPGVCGLAGSSMKGDRTSPVNPWGPLNPPRGTVSGATPQSQVLCQSPGCHGPVGKPGLKTRHLRKRQRLLERSAVLEKAGVLKRNSSHENKDQGSRGGSVCSSGASGELSGSDQLSVKPGTDLLAGSGRKHSPNMEKERTLPLAGDKWEGDSGFSSEASPTASGRSSPCASPCFGPSKLVALDCEMVGTGPKGRCSEVARCSIVGYYGDVLYDKYIQPLQPVTNYRTRWSGIRRHHLLHAIPFKEAQREILKMLKGKIVVGHALHNDFWTLSYFHPRHMTRDTSHQPLLRQRASLPTKDNVSLKNLAKKLLKRDIQVGRAGHSSVEDAMAAMDLYRLVEAEWELQNQAKLSVTDLTPTPEPISSPSHYMQDQYWPEDLSEDSK